MLIASYYDVLASSLSLSLSLSLCLSLHGSLPRKVISLTTGEANESQRAKERPRNTRQLPVIIDMHDIIDR
jgi:hypothetical protein